MRDHGRLKAFQLADEVVLTVYRLTRSFPKDEQFGLAAQMRRAAVSVPSNIVEGCARGSPPEYLRFLEIAFASLRELLYQYSLACRLGYIETSETEAAQTQLEETERVLSALIRSLHR